MASLKKQKSAEAPLPTLSRRILEVGRNSKPKPGPGNKAFKIHRLLDLLQASEHGLTLQQMASSLGVDERTVKRYLSELRKWNCGLVYHQEGSSKKSFYSIQSREDMPKRFIPMLEKIKAELYAGGNPKYSQAISGLVAWLERRDETADATPSPETEAYHIDHGPFAEADPAPGILKILEKAVLETHIVHIRYSGYTHEEAEFKFCPYQICLRVGTLYLIGRAEANKGADKSLVIKRIKRCIATPATFTRDPAFQIREYYKYCFGQWPRQPGEEPENVSLWVREGWLEKYLSESHFNPPGKIVKRAGRTYFELKVLLKPDFINWILSLAPDLIPVAPKSLREQVRERITKTELLWKD